MSENVPDQGKQVPGPAGDAGPAVRPDGARHRRQRALIDRSCSACWSAATSCSKGSPGWPRPWPSARWPGPCGWASTGSSSPPTCCPRTSIGTQVYNPRTGEFTARKGPIFANLVLVDEINRAPAKVQERPAGGDAGKGRCPRRPHVPARTAVPGPGHPEPHRARRTYPLPEPRWTALLLKLQVGYPGKDEELAILDRCRPWSRTWPSIPSSARRTSQSCGGRSTGCISTTRSSVTSWTWWTPRGGRRTTAWTCPYIQYGASPRATISWPGRPKGKPSWRAAATVLPQDVKSVGYDVLRHRLIVTYEAEAEELTPEHLISAFSTI